LEIVYVPEAPVPPPPEISSEPVDDTQFVPDDMTEMLDTPPKIPESPASSIKLGRIIAEGQLGMDILGTEV